MPTPCARLLCSHNQSLDLISYFQSIPDARLRRGIRNPASYLLLMAVQGILSGRQSLGDLESQS